MGELEPWIDENFVRSVWFGMGYQVNVKMIRDKFSGYVAAIFHRSHLASWLTEEAAVTRAIASLILTALKQLVVPYNSTVR